MASASDFLIGANDEHGLNPPTIGKRSPIIPYLGRSFYENEFNKQTKRRFIIACLRCGFNVYDVHPEVQDVSVSRRVVRVNNARLSALVTFAYNASGDGVDFNSAKGYEVYYSPYNPFPNESLRLSELVFAELKDNGFVTARFVGRLSVGVLSNVNCPSTLIEAGFMTNVEEVKLIQNPLYVEQVAERSCEAVCKFFSVDYVANNVENYSTIKINAKGNFVKILQMLLNNYGANLSEDGVFGLRTKLAVEQFQRNNGLSVDGVVGRNTWSKLLNKDVGNGVIKRGSKNSDVLFLQKLLLSFLYPITNLDSNFGPETERAVRAFQQENGLVADGIVGAKTWEKLFSTTGREL